MAYDFFTAIVFAARVAKKNLHWSAPMRTQGHNRRPRIARTAGHQWGSPTAIKIVFSGREGKRSRR